MQVGPEVVELIEQALARGVTWGCLTLRWRQRGLVYRVGERASNLRVVMHGIPFGDQAMFMTRALLDKAGGVPDLPIMEDYELSRRLRSLAGRPRQLRCEVRASARRFEQGGPLRVSLHMRRLRRLYRAGVDPDEIGRMYPDVRSGTRRGNEGDDDGDR